MEEKMLTAATSGDVAELKRLLDAGAPADAKDEFGWTR